VLAVHPNYLFRTAILDRLHRIWSLPSAQNDQYILVGLIREGQLELALAAVKEMHQQNIQVAQWIYSLLMYKLCEAQDFDAVLQVMYLLNDWSKELPTQAWHYILDKASEGLHVETTSAIWRTHVEPKYINPSSGLCHNVLLTAARSGDVRLATSVVKTLVGRQGFPSALELDLLEEACRSAGDPRGIADAEKLRAQAKLAVIQRRLGKWVCEFVAA
jgi:hypothetical protein